MGKWNASSNSRKYNKDWEKQHTWLTLKDDACFCKLCQCAISQFKKHNLVTHEKTEKHRKNEKLLHYTKPIKTLLDQKYKEELKIFDIKFSVSIACHCSIRAVDHLTDIIKEHAKGSDLENVKLHRTKCSAIIKNVVNVSLKEALIEDLKDTKYSILIDETTDISNTKLLCLCVRYFSLLHNTMKTEFLGIVSVTSTTGAALFEEIENFLKQNNISIENCIGFSSDGANNVCGEHNSVLSRLRLKNPNLIFIKCTCHSLDLCCEHAIKKLPSNIEYMISEVARWFKSSCLRQEEFKTIVLLMNDGCVQPSKFVSPCNTRWLVRSKGINSILTQWAELKGYFSVIADKDRNYHARIINEMLADDRNVLYMTFLLPILQEFESVNALFQATDANPSKLFSDLDLFVKSLQFRVERKLLGAKFELELEKSNLSDPEKAVMYERCFDFLVEAYDQVKKRLTDNLELAINLNIFHPKECLSQVRKELKDFPPVFLNLMKGSLDKMENQYNMILFVDWKNEFPSKEIRSDPALFWANVLKYENGLGVKCFKDLAEAALNFFSLPVSNAFVERVFSFVTNVKSKQRNNINVPIFRS